MKVDAKLAIESERDHALRADEYAVISHDREGNEVEVLSFYVTDTGHFHCVRDPAPLVNGLRGKSR
ncbi:hypothetical protein LCGC14_1911130 [marine sediment metagenome]|uniref:Uncharacterized protein n=1 Tax=marine sediment metagenome TaxID=412755 RepID=A0A0F9I7L8_9ZZZZ